MRAETDGETGGGGRLKLVAMLLFVAGLGLTIALLAWHGLGPVTEVLSSAGAGLIWLGPYYALPVLFAALSWRVLFAWGGTPPFQQLFIATWVGLAINWLLPVAQIGGEFVKFRWLRQRGTPGDQAGATVIIGKMIQAFSQVLYTLIGLSLLLLVFEDVELAPVILGGCAIAIAALVIFYRVQRAGFFASLSAMGRRLSRRLARYEMDGGAAALDAAIDEGYRQRRRVLMSLVWRMAFRFVLAGEVWLALYLMGHPISLVEAIILESLIEAVRGAAFAVPAGLGVQEAGILLLGAAMGLPPEVSLALALAKRFRELLVGLPGLLTWQIAEGRILAGRLALVRAERRRDEGSE